MGEMFLCTVYCIYKVSGINALKNYELGLVALPLLMNLLQDALGERLSPVHLV